MAYLEVYKDSSQRVRAWRWRRKGDNHEIMASGEGYTRRASAKRAAKHSFPADGEPRILG